jgi:hypothetical protein
MKRAIVTSCGAFALAVSGIAGAQERCTLEQTIRQCYDQFRESTFNEGQKKQVDETQGTQKEALAEAQTGASSSGAATSTVTDLVPLFDALGLISDSDSEKGKLTLNLNFLLPVQDDVGHNAQLKLIVNTSPKPFDTLVQAFPETVRAARKDTLQKDISAFGESELSLTYSFMNGTFGRDYDRYAPMLEPIFAGAIESVRPSGETQFLQLLTRLTAALGSAVSTAPNTKIKDLQVDDALKEQLRTAIASNAREAEAIAPLAEAEIKGRGLTRLTELIDQQPQLLFTLGHDIRDDIVGPEKTSATLSFEKTAYNLGHFLRTTGGASCLKGDEVRQGGPAYSSCANALDNYFAGPAKNLSTQMRWKLAASYHRVKKWSYASPSDSVSLSLPETDRWEVAFGLGRPLLGRRNGDRIDVEVAYDSNIDDDTSNKERVKATVTYTRRVGDMDVPFSLVYANKDEFLGEVDQQISLHIGLKFKSPASLGK